MDPRPVGLASTTLAAAVILGTLALPARAARTPADLAQTMSVATEVKVTHAAWSETPCGFETHLPCARIRETKLGEARPDTAWTRRFVTALGIEQNWRSVDSLGAPAWLPIAPDSGLVSITLKHDALWMYALPSLRLVAVQDTTGVLGAIDCTRNMSVLLGLLSEAMPHDRLLEHPLTPESLASRPVVTRGTPPLESIGVCDSLPEAIDRVAPRYPDEARDRGVSGRVMLRVRIRADGSVAETRIEESIPLLDAEAVRAAEQWRFKPARLRGRPIPVWVRLPVRFTLH